MPHLPDPRFKFVKDAAAYSHMSVHHSSWEPSSEPPTIDNTWGCLPPIKLPSIDSLICYWSYDRYRHWYRCRTLWRGYESNTMLAADIIDQVRDAPEYVWHHIVSDFLAHIHDIFHGKVPDAQG